MRTRLITAVIFGGVASLVALALLLLWKPNEVEKTLFAQLSPSLIYRTLWPPTMVALVLGTVLGGFFEKTTRLRLGILYAACLGLLLSLPIFYAGSSRFSEVIFALTFGTFDGSTMLELLIWLPGPLTGALVWALLRRPHPPKTS